jgi:hypothetical protein
MTYVVLQEASIKRPESYPLDSNQSFSLGPVLRLAIRFTNKGAGLGGGKQAGRPERQKEIAKHGLPVFASRH